MKYIDINKRFTAIVAEYMAKGYTLNTRTMGGSQGEIANIDLTDGNEIIRVLVCSFHEWDNTSLDGVEIIVGRPTDKAEPNSPVDHVTIWNNRLEVITVERFYQVGEGRYNKKFYGTKNEAEAAQKIRYARWAAREGNRKPQEMSKAMMDVAKRIVRDRMGVKRICENDVSLTKSKYGYTVAYRGKACRLH